MDYNHISNFLGKVKQLLFKNEEYYEIISQVINRHIFLVVDPKLIKIRGSIIYIQSSPLVKNEIMIHKRGILSDISEVLTERKFTDIR